jgi:hypothetical protein
MRRLVGVAVVGLIMSVVSASLYAFTSQTVVAKTAQVQFTGAGIATMDITIRRLDNNNTTNQIFWNTSGITLGTTKWRRADAYVLLNSTVTSGGGGIQIYTNNPILGAGTTSYAGLVSEDGISSLGLAYKVAGSTTSDLDIVPSADFAHLGTVGAPAYYTYMYMANKNNDGTFVNGSMYNLIKQGNSLRSDEGAFGNGSGPGYLYFSADFSNASTPHTYKTTALTFESFVQ